MSPPSTRHGPPPPAKNADYLESTLLRAAGFRHGFFTRRGGVSRGPYRSLNCSFVVGDVASDVCENLARVAAVLDVAPSRLCCLTQVHGSVVHELDGSEDCDCIQAEAGDAVVARQGDLACCVRVADCVPVLLADRRTGAVAAVHAGWRGTVAGIVAAAASRLRAGSGRASLIAAIGPHISQQAFEVSELVATQLARASSASGAVNRAAGCRPRVSLRRIIRAQLRHAGMEAGAVDDVDGCTVSDPELFFSYRRDGRFSGRHLAAIVPR